MHGAERIVARPSVVFRSVLTPCRRDTLQTAHSLKKKRRIDDMDEEEVMSETLDHDNEDTEETESTENEMETEEESTEETTEEEEEEENMKLEEDDDEKSSRRTGNRFARFFLSSVVSAASRRRSNRALRDLPDEDETDAASIMFLFIVVIMG